MVIFEEEIVNLSSKIFTLFGARNYISLIHLSVIRHKRKLVFQIAPPIQTIFVKRKR
jgi:hypothetical protein